MMSGTAGKGHKQTPETLAAVVDGLRSGLTPKRAAMIAGISEGTYFAWRRAGWEAIEATDQDSDEAMSFVVTFALGVEAAISEYMLPLIRRVSDAALNGGRGDWRAAAMILQGRFAANFPSGWRSRKAKGSKSRAALGSATSAAKWTNCPTRNCSSKSIRYGTGNMKE